MKKRNSALIVLVWLLCWSTASAIAQQSRISNFEQEQAATIASQIAQQKSLTQETVPVKVVDTQELFKPRL
jgi:hypothetical protein